MNAAAKVQRRKGAEPCFKPIASDRRVLIGVFSISENMTANGFHAVGCATARKRGNGSCAG